MSSRSRASSRKRQSGGDDSSSSEVEGAEETRTPFGERETYEVFTPVNPEELESHRLDEIEGLDEQIDLLRSAVINPIKYPLAFSGVPDYGLKPNFMLYGPAGTGKTDIVLSIANETGLPIYKVSPSQIQSSFQGRSKRNFSELLKAASSHEEGAIVFLDEADTLLGSAGGGGGGAPTRGEEDTSIVNTFKELVQVGKTRSPSKVVFAAATNSPGRIADVGLLSRFPLKIFVGLPVASRSDKDGTVRAYRSENLARMIDSLNRRRCGDKSDHVLGIPSDSSTLQDLETILFYYTPRELSVLAQLSWARVEVSPFRLDKFRYDPLPGKCTNVYKPSGKGDGTWTLVRKFDSTPAPASSRTTSFSRRAPFQEETKREEDLKKIHELGDDHMSNIRWDYVTFEDVLRTLKSPAVFPSVTLDSLLQFYDYAKNVLRDYEGTERILKLMERGYRGSDRLITKLFRQPQFLRMAPSWDLPPEIRDELSSRGLWTHPTMTSSQQQ